MSDDYEIVIGLEVHSQLLTESKMFCACAATYQDVEPNGNVCPVCLGMPGVLPTVNRKAVEFVVRTGVALGCSISTFTKFDRKNYPYPDLMKGYQISQYDLPIAYSGSLTIDTDIGEKKIGITRVHMEEDVAKLSHGIGDLGKGYSLLDVNRAGVPLMEIVSEPDLRSPDEARSYLIQLQRIVRYLKVSSANMEEGNFRCDANISVRPRNTEGLGSKVEIKNMNSFRAVHKALEYEAHRQIEARKSGVRIVQETRGWDESAETTFSQRVKEEENDYRYFPEPDLPPLVIDEEWISDINSKIPELPREKEIRLREEYGFSSDEASQLTSDQDVAEYFEEIITMAKLYDDQKKQFAKTVWNWMIVELARLRNLYSDQIADVKIKPVDIVSIISLTEEGSLSSTMAKDVFETMYKTGQSPAIIVESKGISQINNIDSIQLVVKKVMDDNDTAVQEYLNGKNQAIRFLVGQVMKNSRGQANPKIVNDLLKEKLESLREYAP